MADTLAGIGSGGCIESIPAGAVGQVLTQGANGVSWANTADDQTASEVPFSAYNSIASTNVQSAMQEIVDECCPNQQATIANQCTIPAEYFGRTSGVMGWYNAVATQRYNLAARLTSDYNQIVNHSAAANVQETTGTVQTLTITNPSPCLEGIATVIIGAPEIIVQNDANGQFTVSGYIEHSINGGAFSGPTGGGQNAGIVKPAIGDGFLYNSAGGMTIFNVSVPAGSTLTIQTRKRYATANVPSTPGAALPVFVGFEDYQVYILLSV